MEQQKAIEQFLERFFGSSDADLYTLIEEISFFQKRRRKEVLFFEGEDGHAVHFLLRGRVKLYRANEDGKEAVIRFVQPGEFFAEILLDLRNRYPVNAIALEDCSLLLIDVGKLFARLQQTPQLAMHLVGILSQRLMFMLKRVEQLAIADIRQRFMGYLRALDQKHRTGVVQLPAPKREIALLLGTTPETFSRLLKKLSEEEMIRVSGKSIQLLAAFENGTDV
ncbi:Crp/Fnr family transcriptional regulator [Syntrophotalea acetylenica]|uniref:Crp/Fnr family transcriptional regulator n=1 Tax=Syntrophotalea acetylenica TaxID=29542 RepID=A0A1L3GGP0_SYNAC|nr:Crp/Fnr family transcriptional regulator [Syntrophotalea acetylenica]APG25059.1 Crp/Fnr family transcriptional regulator [Syntrophotalea acetylenica]APG43130.1 Crp/Fnr family transcriptional regulator [Syntrophotalea acetylenica]